jgi:GGDEF domain-containing protein
VDPSIFRVLVEMETRKAQRMRYVVSLVCVGIEHAKSSGQALAQRVAPGIRATDAVAMQTEDSLTMLLVDAEDTNLPTIMERLRPGLEDVPWSAGGASYPKTAATADELIRQAETMMARAKQQGGRRLSLAA